MSAGVSSPGASNVCVRARSGQETPRQPRDPFLQVTSGSAPDCARLGPFCCQPVFTHPCFSRLRNSAPAAPSGSPPRGFMSPALAREPGLRAFWQGRPPREPAALARPVLSALLPLEWHQLGSRRVRPSPAPASQRLRRPASLRLQGRLCHALSPQRVVSLAAFPNLVVPLFVSPRKCLVTETGVFIHRLTLPFLKKSPSHITSVLYF